MKAPRKKRQFLVIRSRTFKTKRGKGQYNQHYLNLPDEIVQHVPEGTKFRPELTEDGILLRIIHPQEEPPINIPSWAKK